MADDLILKGNEQYSNFIRTIKQRVHSAQIKAALSVNSEMIRLYWDIAEKIIEMQSKSVWGDGFLEQMSKDLKSEFPEMRGFSRRNLELMRQWYRFWRNESEFAKQLVSQIPWGHNLVIVTKSANQEEAFFTCKKQSLNKEQRN
jgi:predicted nuclease of restriction endonuclease-like (RecB) superfamily